MDNYFTKCELAEQLLEKNTAMVGTISLQDVNEPMANGVIFQHN